MIKNLVLDIGNVICEWNPQALSASVINDSAAQQALIDVTVKHSEWLALDKGTISLDDAISNAQARTKIDKAAVAGFYHNLPASLVALAPTVKGMYRAHAAGVPMYILSNMQNHSWTYLKKHQPCFGLCTGHVISAEANLIKPDPAIYKHLTDTFNLKPEECVFVDDMPENIEAAKACGWHGRQMNNTLQGGAIIDELVEQVLAG